MKPTSVIFIIIAGILIVAGVIVCLVGVGIAKNDKVELFADYVDAAGNSVCEYDLKGKNPHEISIDLNETTLEIVGGAERSYVKVENMPVKTYEFWVAGGTVNMKTANAASIVTSMRISESGFGFNGLRHYLALLKKPQGERKVTVYLTDNEVITNVDVNVKTGSITISNLTVDGGCSAYVVTGTLKVENTDVKESSLIRCSTGEIEIDRSKFRSVKAEVEQAGGIAVTLTRQYSCTLKCSTGNIYLDDNAIGSEYSGVYPPAELTGPDDPAENGEPADADKAKDENKETSDADKTDSENTEDAEPSVRLFVGKTNIGDIRVKTYIEQPAENSDQTETDAETEKTE